MKILKLPDAIDPTKKIIEESRRKFGVCPFCGENKGWKECSKEGRKGGIYAEVAIFKGWFGPAKGDWLGWLLPKRWYHWQIDDYECWSCGAKWESDPYPIDMIGLD